MTTATKLLSEPASGDFFNSLLEQIPAKLHDPGSCPGQAFADKDLLQHIDLARVRCRGPSVLFGKVIPPCREAR
jgi:hypothetical protein